jgi:hypothetical protein
MFSMKALYLSSEDTSGERVLFSSFDIGVGAGPVKPMKVCIIFFIAWRKTWSCGPGQRPLAPPEKVPPGMME